MSLYRRQGLTSRASIIFTTSQIPLSDYASFSSTIGNPGWFLQTHLNRQTVWFIQYLNPFLSLFFDPILEPFALFSLTKTVFFFCFFTIFFSCLIFISWSRHCLFTFLQFLSVPSERKKKTGFSRLWSRAIAKSPTPNDLLPGGLTHQRTLDVLHTCHNLPRPDLSTTKFLR